jgi:hypothetical protein
MKSGVISPMYEDAYKLLKVVYDVVFNGEIMYGLQRRTSTFWPIRDSYIEGDAFLNSELGKLYQEVIYYFSHSYKIPVDQMGGYNK